MKRLVFVLAFLLFGAFFMLSPFSAQAQVGDGYANTDEPCSGLNCGCWNQGSALGMTCADGLTATLVDCTDQDAANRLCEVMGPNPKITKCVNSSCPDALDCGCSHEACNGGVCGCYNIGSSVSKICQGANAISLEQQEVACSGSEFTGGQCDSYVGAATINKCVNPLCPEEQDCVCPDGLPVEPTSPENGGNNLTPSPTPTDVCACSDLPSEVFTCPEPDPRQPGKIEGPVFGGGQVPACFQCDIANFPDCAKLSPPPPAQPTVRADELDGNRCKEYTFGSIGSEEACNCSGEICCPTCQEPVVVGGSCDVDCNFDVVGPALGGGCACFGGRCNEFTIEALEPNYFDYGTSGGTENPDESCVQFPNAGVKVVTLNCPGGKTCSKEIVIACNCDEQKIPTPANAGSYLYTAWYKLKDDQFHKLDQINDTIPNPVSEYDEDDAQEAPNPACDINNPSDIRCLNLNQAGIVTSFGDPINTNGAPISHRQWNKTTYTKSTQLTPESFLDYALARKPTHVINSTAELNTLQQNTINILNADLVLSDTTQEGQEILDILQDPARTPYVLVIRGDLTVDHDFNVPEPVTSSPLPITFVVEGGEGATGDLNIHHSVETMGGIFISDTLDFSYDSDRSPYPLKIKGNVISYAAADPLKRNRVDDGSKPSVFVVFDPIVYLNVMDLLSVRTYDWSELPQ